jgi:UDP-N-acetylglucosamine 2-epimerase (non-hydrolysing)
VLNVPCVTVRLNTERPVTLTTGTNRLVPPTTAEIVSAVEQPFQLTGNIPPLWDGHAAARVVDVIQSWIEQR